MTVTKGKNVAKQTQGLWAWHVHHETLVELLTEPIENRIAYIKAEKPKAEQATRLRLLRVCTDQKAIAAALDAYQKAIAAAWDAYQKAIAPALDAYQKAIAPAWDAYQKANAAALESSGLAALHRKECKRCPWDGKTIFPAKKSK